VRNVHAVWADGDADADGNAGNDADPCGCDDDRYGHRHRYDQRCDIASNGDSDRDAHRHGNRRALEQPDRDPAAGGRLL
jgi:hypothetical protein